jgi:hypothetical protein
LEPGTKQHANKNHATPQNTLLLHRKIPNHQIIRPRTKKWSNRVRGRIHDRLPTQIERSIHPADQIPSVPETIPQFSAATKVTPQAPRHRRPAPANWETLLRRTSTRHFTPALAILVKKVSADFFVKPMVKIFIYPRFLARAC